MLTFRTLHQHKAGTEIEVYGEYFTFDKDGWGTLTTDNMTVIKRLLEIPEAYVLHAEAGPPAPTEPLVTDPVAPVESTEPVAPVASPYVLKNDETGEEVDLSAMSDDELKAFVDTAGVKADKRLKGDKLRAAIVAAVAEAG